MSHGHVHRGHDHHGHHHQHHGHSHGHGHGVHAGPDNERRVFWAAVLTGGFMAAELVGGLITGSLALLADAMHMATDSLSLGLAWFAFRLSRRPADRQRTYGFERMQVLIAFANGLMLLVIIAWILVEAVDRWLEPVPVMGLPMAAIATLGLVVNVAAFILLHGGDRSNLNMQGAFLHVLGDLLGSFAALGAGIVILTTGWTPIDPLLSVLVAFLLLRSALHLLRESGHILLEGAPAELDVTDIGADLVASLDEVEDVHHVHAWSLTNERPMLTLHVRLRERVPVDETMRRIKARLHEHFGVEHTTVQIEYRDCADSPNSLTG